MGFIAGMTIKFSICAAYEIWDWWMKIISVWDRRSDWCVNKEWEVVFPFCRGHLTWKILFDILYCFVMLTSIGQWDSGVWQFIDSKPCSMRARMMCIWDAPGCCRTLRCATYIFQEAIWQMNLKFTLTIFCRQWIGDALIAGQIMKCNIARASSCGACQCWCFEIMR